MSRLELDVEARPAGPSPGDAAAAPAGGWVARLGYAFAGLLVLGTILASFNPYFGFFHENRGVDAKLWPWEVFAGPRGPVFYWLPGYIWLLAFTLSGLSLVVCAFLPSGRLRGGLALVTFVLLGTAIIGTDPTFLIGTGTNAALALLAAGGLAHTARPSAPGARRLLFVGWLAVALFVALPLPERRAADDLELDKHAPYQSIVVGVATHVQRALFSDDPGTVELVGGQQVRFTLLNAFLGSLQSYAWVFALLAGLPLLLGLRTRWLGWLLGTLLLVAVAGPPLYVALERLHDASEVAAATPAGGLSSRDALEHVSRGAVESLLIVLRIALLPLALGLLDMLRAPAARPPQRP